MDFLPAPKGKGSGSAVELTGRCFGRLTVLGRIQRTRKGFLWLCNCSCGKQASVPTNSLTSGNTQSCGCLRQERNIIALKKRHGETRYKRIDTTQSKVYKAWHRIKQRCYNPKNIRWEHYGGKGIQMCDGWRSNFLAFFANLGDAPSPTHSIDRINNHGHYSCGQCNECRDKQWVMNCHWATPIEQANNKTNNRHLTFNGETATLAQWSRRVGLDAETLSVRLKKGWTMARSLTTPPRNHKYRHLYIGL